MRLKYLIIIFFILIFLNCERPPKSPIIDGPMEGYINKSIDFIVFTPEPNKDMVAYLFDWGDGTIDSWTIYYPSGETVIKSHTFSKLGDYNVRAKAKDIKGKESKWSAFHQISIVSQPPNIPTISGPLSGRIGISYNFLAYAIDPDGDSVAIRFDWGDGSLSDWSDFVASGTTITMSKSWLAPGTYYVKAKAKDINGAVSKWSEYRIIIYRPDSLNCREIGYYPSSARGIALLNNLAYIADLGFGLRIIDIGNPYNPFEVGYYDIPGWVWDVAVSGNYAYVANYDSGLRIIDVSNPQNPFEVGYYDTPGYAWDVAISGNYAYVADCGGGLRIIDVSNPQNPFEVGYYKTQWCSAQDVALSGNYAYVADYGNGLLIIDISNPQNPFEVGYYRTPGLTRGVTVAGNYAYVADFDYGLRIIDVSNPQNPFEVGYYDTPGEAIAVAVSGNYAYVADGISGLRIIDISNPQRPREVGYYDTADYAWRLAVSGNYIYVADCWDGLRIIEFYGKHP